MFWAMSKWAWFSMEHHCGKNMWLSPMGTIDPPPPLTHTFGNMYIKKYFYLYFQCHHAHYVHFIIIIMMIYCSVYVSCKNISLTYTGQMGWIIAHCSNHFKNQELCHCTAKTGQLPIRNITLDLFLILVLAS